MNCTGAICLWSIVKAYLTDRGEPRWEWRYAGRAASLNPGLSSASRSRYCNVITMYCTPCTGQVPQLVPVPQESCDLNPIPVCRQVTKLLPSLQPQQECTAVPRLVCSVGLGGGRVVQTPLRTEWCLEREQQQYPVPLTSTRVGCSSPVLLQ